MLSSFFPFAFNTNILTLDIFIIEIKIVSAELELNYSIGEKRQHIKNLKTYIVIFNSYLKLTKPELFIKLFPLFAGNKSREIIPLLHNHFITIAHHQYQSMVTPCSKKVSTCGKQPVSSAQTLAHGISHLVSLARASLLTFCCQRLTLTDAFVMVRPSWYQGQIKISGLFIYSLGAGSWRHVSISESQHHKTILPECS